MDQATGCSTCVGHNPDYGIGVIAEVGCGRSGRILTGPAGDGSGRSGGRDRAGHRPHEAGSETPRMARGRSRSRTPISLRPRSGSWLPTVGRVMSVGFRPADGAHTAGSDRPGRRTTVDSVPDHLYVHIYLCNWRFGS